MRSDLVIVFFLGVFISAISLQTVLDIYTTRWRFASHDALIFRAFIKKKFFAHHRLWPYVMTIKKNYLHINACGLI
jgi:hypothetical protein